MNVFTPTDLDLYPGQPTDEALTWAFNFCVRNSEHFAENGGAPIALILKAYAYYRAIVLAQNRYNEMTSFLNGEIYPPKEKLFKKRTFIKAANDQIREN